MSLKDHVEFSLVDGDSDGPQKVDACDAKDDDGTPERQTWSKQMDFIISTIGCAVGLGNIWRFPYLCYKNGGGAFLIPYFVCFFAASVPMFVLEVSLGQYMREGCVGAWNIVPAFRGIGMASQIIMFYMNTYYMVIISWAVYYIAMSFTSPLPWATCDNEWNTDRCFVTGMNITAGLTNCSGKLNCTGNEGNVTAIRDTVDSVVEFWERRALHISSGISEPGSVVPGLAVALLVTWVIIYLCIFRGVKWTGKVVYVTVIAPYILLTVLFVRGVTLDGAAEGLKYYLKPDFTRLSDPQVWIDGGTQVFYSIGISLGFMVTLGSYNKFNYNSYRNSLVIASINSCTSVYGGLAVFSVLGFMAKEQNLSIDDVAESGPGLVFITYPKAVTQMPLSSMWSVLFFFTIFLVGLDSAFLGVEGFVTPIIDAFPRVLYRTRNRAIFLAFYCAFCFLMSLPMITEGGIYVFQIFDYYSASGMLLLFVSLCEAVAVGWVFGADRFYDAMELMMGFRISPWLKISWKFTTPIVTIGIFLFQAVRFTPLKYNRTYEYPVWAHLLGMCLALSSAILIPAVFAHSFSRASGSFRQRLRYITTPILKPHQVVLDWKMKDYKWRSPTKH